MFGVLGCLGFWGVWGFGVFGVVRCLRCLVFFWVWSDPGYSDGNKGGGGFGWGVWGHPGYFRVVSCSSSS